jgi:hypothetical protein
MNDCKKIKTNNAFLFAAILLALVSSALFTVVTFRMWNYSDYPMHIAETQILATSGQVDFPHTAYHQITIITRAIIPFTLLNIFGSPFSDVFPKYSFQIAGLMVVILFNVGLALLIFDRIKKENAQLPRNLLLGLCFFVPLILGAVAPISLFTLPQHNLYYGYIGINVYHNPTIVLLKTASLFLFWLILDHFESKDLSFPLLLGVILATIFDLFCKPNFIIVFLPVICVLALWRIIKKKDWNWKLIIFGLFVPSVIILILQYALMYSTQQSGGIAFSFLQAVLTYVPTVGGAFLRLIFSLGFPLIVLILFFKKVMGSLRLLASYGTLVVGIILMYFVIETGPRAYHANFWWSAQIALFILFVELTLFCIREFSHMGWKQAIRTIRFWATTGVFSLHFISGVIWYAAEVLRPHLYWGLFSR